MAKWRKRRSVADLPTGPKTPRSTVLSVEEEGRQSESHPHCRRDIANALIDHVSGAIEDLTNAALVNRVVPLPSTIIQAKRAGLAFGVSPVTAELVILG